MSATSVAPRPQRRGAPDRRPEPDTADGWIGVDLAHRVSPRRPRVLLPLFLLALVAALGVAALRIDLIRTRYAVASALAEEHALIEAQRALIVRRRQLRDPARLAALARERGFRPAVSVISLRDPIRRTASNGSLRVGPAAVSAGPPDAAPAAASDGSLAPRPEPTSR